MDINRVNVNSINAEKMGFIDLTDGSSLRVKTLKITDCWSVIYCINADNALEMILDGLELIRSSPIDISNSDNLKIVNSKFIFD